MNTANHKKKPFRVQNTTQKPIKKQSNQSKTMEKTTRPFKVEGDHVILPRLNPYGVTFNFPLSTFH